MKNATKRSVGRPAKYPLSANQVRAIKSRLGKGMSSRAIQEEMGLHSFAVLRIRREFNKEQSAE